MEHPQGCTALTMNTCIVTDWYLWLYMCRFWRWWVPTYTALEKARLLDVALTVNPREHSLAGTEFAAL